MKSILFSLFLYTTVDTEGICLEVLWRSVSHHLIVFCLLAARRRGTDLFTAVTHFTSQSERTVGIQCVQGVYKMTYLEFPREHCPKGSIKFYVIESFFFHYLKGQLAIFTTVRYEVYKKNLCEALVALLQTAKTSHMWEKTCCNFRKRMQTAWSIVQMNADIIVNCSKLLDKTSRLRPIHSKSQDKLEQFDCVKITSRQPGLTVCTSPSLPEAHS